MAQPSYNFDPVEAEAKLDKMDEQNRLVANDPVYGVQARLHLAVYKAFAMHCLRERNNGVKPVDLLDATTALCTNLIASAAQDKPALKAAMLRQLTVRLLEDGQSHDDISDSMTGRPVQ